MLFLVLTLFFISGCISPECDPGFEFRAGNCYRRSYDGDTAPPDTAPETGETGIVDTDTAETGETASGGLSVLEPGAFVGYNVFVLSLDATTKDAAMPNLAAIMGGDDGYILRNHACGASWTQPCSAMLMTGNGAFDAGQEIFRPEGGNSAGVVNSDVVTFGRAVAAKRSPPGIYTENWNFGGFNQALGGFDPVVSAGGLDQSAANAAVLSMVSDLASRGGPWTAWYHSMGLHAPYVVSDEPAEYYAECGALPEGVDILDDRAPDQMMALDPAVALAAAPAFRCYYDGKARWLDKMLFGPDGLLEQMRSQGLMEHTLVVVLSDHGEAFAEGSYDTGTPVYGHNSNTRAPNVATIAAFWAEDLAGGEWTGNTGHEDIAPTLLSLLDLPIPEGMTGHVLGGAGPEDRNHYRCGPIPPSVGAGSPVIPFFAVTSGEYRYHLEGDVWRVFDLVDDPGEARPIDDMQIDPVVEGVILDAQSRSSEEHWCG